jgi:RNA polymerase sigma-70 factor, ECF subfamily
MTPKLLSVAKRFLRNEDDAADAVQDTFVSALTSIDKFRGESSVYTWLYRILVNVCLMSLRSSTRSKCVSFEYLSQLCDGREFREPATSLADLPEAQLENEYLVKHVRECVDQLPADYRNIILLRDIEQFDTDETSRLLRVSRGVVKTRLHRARRALRAMIEQDVGNPYESQQAIGNLS